MSWAAKLGKLLPASAAAVALPDEAALASLNRKLLASKLKSLIIWVTDFWEPMLVSGCMLVVVVFAMSQEFLVDESKDERLMFNWLHEQERGRHEFVEVLDYVSIDPHGGLQKIEELSNGTASWGMRVLTCITRLMGAVFNMFFLIELNTRIMKGACAYYEPGHDASLLPEDMQRYMSYTSSMALVGVRHAALVAVFELGGTLVLVTMAIYRVVIFSVRRRSPTNKFDAFVSLFEAASAIFTLSTFSALKLFAVVHPALVWRDFDEHLAKPFFGHSKSGLAFQVVYFFISRTLAFLVGVCAFGVKVAFVSVYLFKPISKLSPLLSLLWRWGHLFALLVQTMGALIMEKVLLTRVLNFVAGGKDTKVSEKAYVMREVYMARVAQAIYEEYWVKNRKFEFFVVLITFNDLDLQRLLLDEDEVKKIVRIDDYQSVLRKATTMFSMGEETVTQTMDTQRLNEYFGRPQMTPR